MNVASHCAAIIPCHNEAATVAMVVGATRQQVPTVIVVDDGSSDETAQLAKGVGAQVLRHPVRQGKGAALETGLQHALAQGFEWGLTLDGDGQHSPQDIPAFLNGIRSGEARLIVGNRMPQAAKIPFVRRWVNRFMSWMISLMAGQRLPDSQCGFRLVNLKAWSSVGTRSQHFEFESEMLLSFARSGHGIRFVPVEVIYRKERSKISPLRDTVRWFCWLFRARHII